MPNLNPEINDEQEVWKQIPGIDGFEISSWGNLREHQTMQPVRVRDNVYLTVSFPGDKKPYYVHRLVALAFIGEPPNDAVVNHKDLNKHNNHISNLEYVSRRYNIQHARAAYRDDVEHAQEQRLIEMLELRAAGWTYSDIGKHVKMSIAEVREIIRQNRDRLPDDWSYDYITLKHELPFQPWNRDEDCFIYKALHD